MDIKHQTQILRRKLANLLVPESKIETPSQPVKAITRREALDIANISIEEYRDLIDRRQGKAVETKKQPTLVKVPDGPLEEFFTKIRKAYKERKLIDKNKFKFISSKEHLMDIHDGDTIVAELEEYNAVTLFYSWYVKKYGVKEHHEKVV